MAIIEVVKYNGTPDVFVWKYPSEELGTWTQLIVNESQEAILFKGGQALDVFPSGRHTLETANIPILNNLINLPFGGRSPFAAEVWYINKAFSLDIKWGTPTPIQLQDPKYKVFIPLRSFGQFGIQIDDSKKFLVKLVGTLSAFTKDDITKYFRGLYLTIVKDAISSYLVHEQISLLEINAHLEELSECLKVKMLPILAEYGIKLINFYVNDINVPEDDSAVIKLKEALAKRAEMDIVGYSYVQERSFDTLEGAATNPGSASAGLMGAGMGLGLGVGIGGGMGTQMGAIANAINTTYQQKNCPKCNAVMEKEKRFCSDCGCDTLNYEQSKGPKVIVCSNCGASYTLGVKFCPECGNAYNPCLKCQADVKKGTTVCSVCGVSMPKVCPNCGGTIENEKTKFCPECGTSLVKKCPNCNTEIKGDPKFCSECGCKL
ncbi:SPFH domain-containing protein [Candidatus Formimonas warabiya]|uniref:Antifreeze protein type I n=1 Tax=Formimonas warabiya TaxID=1761012 RepID=A0A3G1KWH3_FORW1|nr:SPFH domain-containing protein [Candidatus Formimonas warabiya]ATW26802.1 antifreeze protein type I [Candidatus Formimonas warabiya]